MYTTFELYFYPTWGLVGGGAGLEVAKGYAAPYFGVGVWDIFSRGDRFKGWPVRGVTGLKGIRFKVLSCV